MSKKNDMTLSIRHVSKKIREIKILKRNFFGLFELNLFETAISFSKFSPDFSAIKQKTQNLLRSEENIANCNIYGCQTMVRHYICCVSIWSQSGSSNKNDIILSIRLVSKKSKFWSVVSLSNLNWIYSRQQSCSLKFHQLFQQSREKRIIFSDHKFSFFINQKGAPGYNMGVFAHEINCNPNKNIFEA